MATIAVRITRPKCSGNNARLPDLANSNPLKLSNIHWFPLNLNFSNHHSWCGEVYSASILVPDELGDLSLLMVRSPTQDLHQQQDFTQCWNEQRPYTIDHRSCFVLPFLGDCPYFLGSFLVQRQSTVSASIRIHFVFIHC